MLSTTGTHKNTATEVAAHSPGVTCTSELHQGPPATPEAVE